MAFDPELLEAKPWCRLRPQEELDELSEHGPAFRTLRVMVEAGRPHWGVDKRVEPTKGIGRRGFWLLVSRRRSLYCASSAIYSFCSIPYLMNNIRALQGLARWLYSLQSTFAVRVADISCASLAVRSYPGPTTPPAQRHPTPKNHQIFNHGLLYPQRSY